MMESNSRNIILNYTDLVLNSRMCLETQIEDENGVLKYGLMDFIATRAQPNMFYKFDHVMEKMKQAWSNISRREIERLSNAFQRARIRKSTGKRGSQVMFERRRQRQQ